MREKEEGLDLHEFLCAFSACTRVSKHQNFHFLEILSSHHVTLVLKGCGPVRWAWHTVFTPRLIQYFKNLNVYVMATTSALEQLAEEKEQELVLIRQQQAQAVQETLKGQL